MLRLATPSAGFTTAVLSACLRCLSSTLAAALAFADSANGPSYAHRSRREQTGLSDDIVCANGGSTRLDTVDRKGACLAAAVLLLLLLPLLLLLLLLLLLPLLLLLFLLLLLLLVL